MLDYSSALAVASLSCTWHTWESQNKVSGCAILRVPCNKKIQRERRLMVYGCLIPPGLCKGLLRSVKNMNCGLMFLDCKRNLHFSLNYNFRGWGWEAEGE